MEKPSLWQRTRNLIFAGLVVSFLVIDFAVLHMQLGWVTGYLAMATAVVIGIQMKYRESVRPVSPPTIAPQPIDRKTGRLSLMEMLLHEFDYIKETAAQAMNDRHTMVNYFLLTTGVVLAAMSTTIGKESGWNLPYRNQIIIALSLVFNAVGWVYFLQIIRLRQAWCESARAMNHIKEFFAQNCEYPYPLAHAAFRWQPGTIPPPAKKMNVFYLSAVLIALLSAAAIGLATIVLLGLETARAWPLMLFVAALALYHLVFQMSMYTALLEERPAPRPESAPSPALTGPSSDLLKPTARKVELLEEKVVFDDFFKLVEGRLRFEKFDGTMSEKIRRLSFERGDAVTVVLHNAAQNTLVLIEQFRYPAYRAYQHQDGWIYELVAGTVEEGETPEQVARREVMEEAGYVINHLEMLGRILPSPGGASERIFVFYAQIGEKKGKGGGAAGEHEDIRVMELPVQQVYAMVQQGAIEDAKTLVGLLLAREKVVRREA